MSSSYSIVFWLSLYLLIILSILSDKTGNTVVEEPVLLESSRKRRTAEAEGNTAENVVEAEDEEACRVEMWRCLSTVIEHGLHYMDKPEGLMGYVIYLYIYVFIYRVTHKG